MDYINIDEQIELIKNKIAELFPNLQELGMDTDYLNIEITYNDGDMYFECNEFGDSCKSDIN